MKIKKTTTEKTIAANRANARKSIGPTTPAGKRRAKMNSLKHSFFAKELQIAEEDRPEYEDMRDGILLHYVATTPLQQIAVGKIVCCCFRCKLALRMESRAVALHQRPLQEPQVESEKDDPHQLDRWYGADYRSLQAGLSFLRDLRADVAANGLLHIEQDGPRKESVVKGFGLGFYDRLTEWKGMNTQTILLAEHLAAGTERFGFSRLPIADQEGDPDHPETPKVVADPRLEWQMAVKLIDAEIEHLDTLVKTRRQDFGESPQVLAEFSPRYFADASRDLERAVDWFLKLKGSGL